MELNVDDDQLQNAGAISRPKKEIMTEKEKKKKERLIFTIIVVISFSIQ